MGNAPFQIVTLNFVYVVQTWVNMNLCIYLGNSIEFKFSWNQMEGFHSISPRGLLLENFLEIGRSHEIEAKFRGVLFA